MINKRLTGTALEKFIQKEIEVYNNSLDEIENSLNYFRRSRTHWLYLLSLMESYYTKKKITKSDLIHKIQMSHITILKYIKESIYFNLVEELQSTEDKRKIILLPKKNLVNDFEKYFIEHIDDMKIFFEQTREGN